MQKTRLMIGDTDQLNGEPENYLVVYSKGFFRKKCTKKNR